MQYMQYPAGRSPSQLAFDGTNIWVLNFVNDGTVTKLRASDGQPLGVYPVGPWPSRLVTDGYSVWVSSRSGTTRLRASDGVPLNWPANETVCSTANIFGRWARKSPGYGLRMER